jgi:hypothetical protein
MEIGEIVLGQPAAVFLLMARDRAGDVTAIERIARRLQAGKSIAVGVGPLLIRHVLQRAGEIGLHEDLAHLGRPSVGQENGGRGRPVCEVILPGSELLGQERIGRETLAREADRGCRHLAERHRAEARQSGDPDARSGGNHRVQQALGNAPIEVTMEMLDAGGLRPDADAADHMGLAAFAEVDHGRRDTAEAHELALQHVDRETRRDARIDRVAAGFQDLQAGERGVVVAGHHHVAARHHIGTTRPRGAKQVGRVRHQSGQ